MAGRPPRRPSAGSSGSLGRPSCEESTFKLGLDAIDLSFTELIPQLGEPVAVQRRVEYQLAPGLQWSVLCYLDLETRRPAAGEVVPAVVDYKVKTTPLTQYKADHDFQPAVYLAGRWLESDPAGQFCFAQIAKPGICRFPHIPGYVAAGTMLLPAFAVGRWGAELADIGSPAQTR
jgi:hypothetical protein